MSEKKGRTAWEWYQLLITPQKKEVAIKIAIELAGRDVKDYGANADQEIKVKEI